MFNFYAYPELRDLSQGSRIAFARHFRHKTQDYVSKELGLTGDCRRRSMTRYEKRDRNPKEDRTYDSKKKELFIIVLSLSKYCKCID